MPDVMMLQFKPSAVFQGRYRRVSAWLSLLLVIGLLFFQQGRAQEEPTSGDRPEAIELRSLVEKTNNYPIDLQTVLTLIADQNLPLAQSKVDVDISQSLLRQRQAALLPSIDGAYSQSRFEGGTQVFGGETFNVIRTTVQPQVGASWTLYPGGRQIYEILAAKRRKAASEFQVTETYQQQLSNAAQEYYKLLSANLQREIALKGISEAEAQLALNQALLDAGRGLKLDVMRSQAALALQKQLLTVADTALIQAEQALLNRLNLEASIHLIPKAEEGKQQSLVPDSVASTRLIETALVEHPMLKRVTQELEALGVDYKVIRSDFIPSVTVRGYLNRTGPDWNNLIQSNFRGITVSANLLENLGLQIPFRLQEKKGEITRKLLERKEVVRNIETQVTTSFLSSKNYESTIKASREGLSAAEEAYRLAIGRYKAGYGTNLDVIDAQTALSVARINVAQAILNYNQAQVQLLEALGKATPENLINGVSFNATTSP